MKKVFNLYNISLLLILVLISVLTLKTTEVKAAGTLTWPSGSTATISRTVQNVYNAPEVEFTYGMATTTATFLRGRDVNSKMKTLANGTSTSQSADDNTIQAIKRGTSLPSGFTPSSDNTASATTSNYPIYLWWDNTTHTIYYYSEADVIYLNHEASRMFYTMKALTDISGLSSLNTSNATTMEYMFHGCSALTNINALSNWDMSQVSVMAYMLQNCSVLTNINGASNWDTSSVTNMTSMFRYDANVTGTIQILGNPTSYATAFNGAATASGAGIIVNYGSETSNIDSIIATKSASSNVVKGSVTTVPAPPTSGFSASITFNGTETVSNTYTVNKSTTINLANVGLSFTEPGNYEYTVSESATSNNAYPTTNTEYTIVITVRNELNANNRPTGNLEARFYIKDANDNKVNTMSFSAPKDESKFGHIELTKKVKGLMGSITKYFEFSVQIDDAASNACSSYSGNEKYPISGVDSDHYSAAEVTKCKSGTKDSLSLKHNQTAIIGQFTYNNNTYDSISIDDYYKIIESAESDYTTTFKINSGSTTSGRDTGSKAITHSGNIATFYNQREGSPLTGLILTILPYLILVGIGVGGVLLYKNRKELLKIKI